MAEQLGVSHSLEREALHLPTTDRLIELHVKGCYLAMPCSPRTLLRKKYAAVSCDLITSFITRFSVPAPIRSCGILERIGALTRDHIGKAKDKMVELNGNTLSNKLGHAAARCSHMPELNQEAEKLLAFLTTNMEQLKGDQS